MIKSQEKTLEPVPNESITRQGNALSKEQQMATLQPEPASNREPLVEVDSPDINNQKQKAKVGILLSSD